MAGIRASARGGVACALALAAALASPGAAAQEPAPLVVYYAPPTAAPGVRAARDAVERAATSRGAAVVDLSPPAAPPPAAPSALRRAIESYHGFSYSQALAEIDAALAEAAETGARGLRPVELSDLFIYRALALTAQGDTASAWDDFARAAAIDATRTLDPARFSPGVVSSFQRAAAAASGGERTELDVDVDPECKVAIDARPHRPREALSLARGVHFVRVECPGYAGYGARVVADRARQTVRPALLSVAAPGDERVVDEARARGAAVALYARVSLGRSGQPTLALRLLTVATGKERARVVLTLRRGEGQRAQRATAAVIDDVVSPRLDLAAVPPKKRRWYEQPWVWGAAGAAVAAAVLLPFALDRGAAQGGFDVVPEGLP